MAFSPNPECLPRPGDEAAAANGLTRWAEIAAHAGNDEISAFARDFAADAKGHALLAAVFGNSPFLSDCLLQTPDTLAALVARGPEAVFDDALAQAAARRERSEADTIAALRQARRKVALIAALADLNGDWPVLTVTGALSRFADTALNTALNTLLWQGAAQNEIKLTDENDPASRAGLFLLAMGKLGAHELNYSSDIDLIALYDAERLDYVGRQSPQQFFIRVVQGVVRILESRTRDGYVFRTDLRLRPDPGSTPVAISVRAAEGYYESTGQNWERAAMIKARVAAGDDRAGSEFLAALRPFLWRKNLDFAAIEDIHSIKRQINAHRGGGTIKVAGHNLKLGRGGIREVEFFGQTQQLIWGGRVPELRTAATCDTLAALAAQGRIGEAAARELTESYLYLRRAEHRLQMVADRQTHSVPDDPAEVARFAAFMGYPDSAAFAKELTAHLSRVENHYAHLFEEAPTLAGPGNLVFTGGEDDPETLKTLAGMGFSDVSMISDRVRNWHRGRFRATRSARARELLTELMPGLLSALANSANPDAAFRYFDQFLAGLPAGVQIFSLFLANPPLMALVAEIMGSAPKLAVHLAANPSLLDGVLTGDFYGPIESKEQLSKGLAAALKRAGYFEETLDLARRFANDHKFKVGMQILKGTLDCDAACRALTDLADVVLAQLFDVVRADIEAKHGKLAGTPPAARRGMCLIALGKLGGREITENSDLDLLFLYDDPPPDRDGADRSDGPRPLAAGQYFARLSQQLITAIAAPTAEGKLYEVDMRLRPSGNAGPIATTLAAFEQYQATSAWTWEHMALTRARVVAGPDDLAARAAAAIAARLTAARDPAKLKADVLDMRVRLERGHPASGMWDVKYAAGGLIDVEFIAQYLQLRHAAGTPDVLDTNTCAALARLEAVGALAAADAKCLIRANRLWRTIQGMLRFTYEGTFSEEAAPAGLKEALLRATESKDFDALKAAMETTARDVRTIFVRLIGDPATTASS